MKSLALSAFLAVLLGSSALAQEQTGGFVVCNTQDQMREFVLGMTIDEDPENLLIRINNRSGRTVCAPSLLTFTFTKRETLTIFGWGEEYDIREVNVEEVFSLKEQDFFENMNERRRFVALFRRQTTP